MESRVREELDGGTSCTCLLDTSNIELLEDLPGLHGIIPSV